MDVHKRGTLVRAGWARWWPWPFRHRGALTLGGIPLTRLDETKHFKVIGSTGTGKTTVIGRLLAGALARGDRAVIADPDGSYLACLYDSGRDVLLNPFESGSLKWDPFAEIRVAYDVEQQLASGLIPSSEDAAGQEWRGYARTFLIALMRRCHERGIRNPAELWRLITSAPLRELRKLVSETPAQPFLDPDNARMFASIRSVTGSAAAALQYVQAQRAPPFSVRNWVREGAGSLFVPYRAGQIAALRSIIATWMRLAIFEAMGGRKDEDQRLWFVVDELDALGAIQGLKDALARLRKFGGRCVLGLQSLAQVSSTYGSADAQTIVENCGNSVILRCSGSDSGGTAYFASRLIGEREIVRRQISRARDRWGTDRAARGARSVSVSST